MDAFLIFVSLSRQEMKLRIYQIDAFTDRIFSGNPAAVCPFG
ncbi:hypothetical protein SAMN05444682_103393 [Parapedobacter indicus]|uniref:PhzF family phenazine biosynthesis protein n=1 Tax=Parapedobacter indicus TaxID=1477437 RepID=A0A1I3HJX0_9SPHI|nr:hypothetical protein CLV26_103394 [Parapedobacter indicus]SFI35961.1 hypothetical protein SAMN05444682_103393 [Parapedobacter indicus]